MKLEYKEALSIFLDTWHDVRAEYYNKHLKSLSVKPLDIKPGRKFDKIVEIDGNRSYVKCFVEKSTGYIYKAAGYRKPAKGPRASIFEPKSYEALDAHTGWLYRRGCGTNDFVPANSTGA